MTKEDPKFVAREMVDYAEELAQQMLVDMDDDECVAMVRDFISVMIEWQPNIAAVVHDPGLVAISSLTTAALFQSCFAKAYVFTDKKVDAMNAISKAFES